MLPFLALLVQLVLALLFLCLSGPCLCLSSLLCHLSCLCPWCLVVCFHSSHPWPLSDQPSTNDTYKQAERDQLKSQKRKHTKTSSFSNANNNNSKPAYERRHKIKN